MAARSRNVAPDLEPGGVPLTQDPVRGLRFKQTKASYDEEHMRVRNHFAVQSALYRGDTDVEMHNTDTWLPHQRLPRLPLNRPNSSTDPANTLLLGFGGRVSSEPPKVSAEINTRILQIMHPTPAWEGFEFISHELVAIGGNGVVLSARVRFQNRREQQVIIKMPRKVKDDEELERSKKALREERKWHQKYAGATHTVQTCDLNVLARQNADPFWAATYPSDSLHFDEDELGIMVLERAEYGDLQDFLNRVKAHGLTIPRRALWSMWLCLTKMLASIDYQPSSNQMEDKDFEAWLKTAEKNPSTVADFVKDFSVSHHVHFDLNIPNVLLTSSVTSDHDQHPLYKAHDFDEAWSKDMRESWKDDGWTEGRYWRMRFTPKIWLTPEQVSREWDDFIWGEDNGRDKFRGEDLTQGADVAGRYGSWTNVFSIGVIMESVLTGIWMRYPFRPKSYQPRNGSLSLILTYGWRIPQFAPHADPDLCEIVMRCQAVEPKDRPTSAELLEYAALYMPRDEHSQPTDLELQNFYNTVFHKPLPGTQRSSGTSDTDDMPSTAPPPNSRPARSHVLSQPPASGFQVFSQPRGHGASGSSRMRYGPM
ncbi:hypothetical protein LIA77_01022 [Sarocladium implicatum]|nr:hypothetical protein LIA77_01022 [Sarocladium implicatum]